MSTKKTVEETEKKPEAPEVLELTLETKEVKRWQPTITISGQQIRGMTDEDFHQLRANIEEMCEKREGDKIFSEIEEIQNILKRNPIKRDDKGKPIMQRHPQLGFETYVEMPFDIDEQRPRNRLLWHIDDLLKGRDPKDVKSITLKFTVTANLKQPKWDDAIFLSNLVKHATAEHSQLGYWIVDLADKFLDQTEGIKAKAEKLIKTK